MFHLFHSSTPKNLPSALHYSDYLIFFLTCSQPVLEISGKLPASSLTREASLQGDWWDPPSPTWPGAPSAWRGEIGSQS